MKAPKPKPRKTASAAPRRPARAPALDAFVLNWGDLGRIWGMPRSAGRIHGLLLAADEPMSAEEIADALSLARSNVSTSLRELRNLGVIQPAAALGDRAERFAALEDPMAAARAIAAARKAREFDPATSALRAAADAAADAAGGPAAARLEAYAALAEKTAAWADESARLSDDALKTIMSLGAKAAGLAGAAGGKKKKKKKSS